jgi:hypothetical protein
VNRTLRPGASALVLLLAAVLPLAGIARADEAARALGCAGAAAEGAISALERVAAKDVDPATRETARVAVAKIREAMAVARDEGGR